jgi:penicillin-binding protein 1C
MWPNAKKLCLASSIAILLVLCLHRLYPPDLSRAKTLSLEVQDSTGKTLNLTVSPDGMWRLPVTPADISPNYVAMLIGMEDRRFFHHPGVDPLALLRALGQLAIHGHVVSGGSTLTMQVARLLHPHPHTLLGKFQDMAQALQLEAHLDKNQILSLYLTLAPFGGNIEGVRAASLLYFGHGPKKLSRQEAALLVALPQSPTRRRPDRHPQAAIRAMRTVYARSGLTPPENLQAPTRQKRPFAVPYLADQLRQSGSTGIAHTTLDGNLQAELQALAKREANWLGSGADLAVLITRNSDRAVLGYLGGTNYFSRFGMIDMVRARRSPGSALKPFIYGMALDDSLILPDTLIDDAPLRIADYAPHDFDRAFHGTVTATEALQQSYNLPAVALLDWIGPARFAAALRQAGAHLALPGNAPATLPLALGGVGISLWDMHTLYTGLGSQGMVAPLRILQTDPQSPGTAIMTRQAAAQICAMLRNAPVPDGVAADRVSRIAYKTGTSYGFRDAWALGTTPAFTAGIWAGRADGTPRPGAFAREVAAPILFKIFDLLPATPQAQDVPGQPDKSRAPSLLRLPGRGTQTGYPRIVYPPPNAVLELHQATGLALEAQGGKPPYRWTVNGFPLPLTTPGMAPSWKPDGPGFTHLTLTDNAARSVEETVRVQ